MQDAGLQVLTIFIGRAWLGELEERRLLRERATESVREIEDRIAPAARAAQASPTLLRPRRRQRRAQNGPQGLECVEISSKRELAA